MSQFEYDSPIVRVQLTQSPTKNSSISIRPDETMELIIDHAGEEHLAMVFSLSEVNIVLDQVEFVMNNSKREVDYSGWNDNPTTREDYLRGTISYIRSTMPSTVGDMFPKLKVILTILSQVGVEND